MFELVLLIWLHFVADFLLQTDKMALKKSESEAWLALHVAIYTLPFFWFGWYFAVVNGVIHYITDYFTSRTAKYFWNKDQRHWFFVTIGFDQAIHITTLLLSYHLIIGGI